MPTRSARTTWTGDLEDGTGTVTLMSSSGLVVPSALSATRLGKLTS